MKVAFAGATRGMGRALARLMAENPQGNLSEKQVEYARTIHSSGSDLLGLINEILDLSKIESGKMAVDLTEVSVDELSRDVMTLFKELAEDKDLAFSIEIQPGAPTKVLTDKMRLQQVLRNLLSNAFKFTEQGRIALTVSRVYEGWGPACSALDRADQVLAFAP